MKKVFTTLTVVLLSLALLAGCGGSGKTAGNDNESGRVYNAFTLASSFNVMPNYYQYHSENIVPFGEGQSNNNLRFDNKENDKLLEKMKYANPLTEKAEWREDYKQFLKLWNEELPLLPMYANVYFDLYNSDKLTDFNSGPLWGWKKSIIEAKSSEPIVVAHTADWNNEFISGYTNNAYDNDVRALVFGNGLLVADEDGNHHPNFMVEDYEVSEDQKEWKFTIKDGIKFSDGEPLTVEDVYYTYMYYANPDHIDPEKGAGNPGGRSSGYSDYEGWEAFDNSCLADDYDPDKPEGEDNVKYDSSKCDESLLTGISTEGNTITFKITKPEFTTIGGFEDLTILPKHYYTDHTTTKTQLMNAPMGAGPYKLVEYLEGQHMVFEINEHYPGNFRGVKPSIEKIIYKKAADETVVDELLAGDVDLLPGQIQDDKIKPVEKAKEDGLGYDFNSYDRHGYGLLGFHADFGVGSHKEVRQALAFGIDRPTFIKEFVGSYGSKIDAPYSLPFVVDEKDFDNETSSVWSLTQQWIDEELTDYSKDPAKAIEVMEAAGWTRGDDKIFEKDGVKAELSIASPSTDWASAMSLVTDKTVDEIGIKVNIESVDFNVLLEHYYGSYKGS